MLPRVVSKRYVSWDNFGKGVAELGHWWGSAVQETLRKTGVYCITLNSEVLSEYWIGKDVEGNRRDPIPALGESEEYKY
jgi:hypothetical protein